MRRLSCGARSCRSSEAHTLFVCLCLPGTEYFPREFDFHLDEKNREWRNTPLIPFVDEKRLLEVCEELDHRLTPEEHRRNAFGPAWSFKHSVYVLLVLASSVCMVCMCML